MTYNLSFAVRPKFTEMSVRGAAIAAGLAVGVWPNTDHLPIPEADVFAAVISEAGMYVCTVFAGV